MNVTEFARRILLSSDINAKITARVSPSAAPMSVSTHFLTPLRPARPQLLKWQEAGLREVTLPKLQALEDPTQRGILLHYFANHELLAMELMALALLKFPEAPDAFRQGLIHTIYDEQAHFTLYQRRMAELGVPLGAVPVNDFFWRTLAPMKDPLAYVVGMSLTFEQANLDFALFYQQIFTALGDLKTARILAKVLADEIAHVKHGVTWFDQWHNSSTGGVDPWQWYCDLLEAPLSPSRAKGPLFNSAARLQAGLSPQFTRSLQAYAGSKGRPPGVWIYNPGFEDELAADSPAFNNKAPVAAVTADLAPLLALLAIPGDHIVCPRPPSSDFVETLQQAGWPAVIYSALDPSRSIPNPSAKYSGLHPWGWSKKTYELLQPLAARLTAEAATSKAWLQGHDFHSRPYRNLAAKTAHKALAAACLQALPALQPFISRESELGRNCATWLEVQTAVESLAHQGLHTWVLKAPFGASGRRQFVATAADLSCGALAQWLAPILRRQGAVLVEPWLNKVCEISLLLDINPRRPNPHLGVSFFFTSARGAYRGHLLGSVINSFPTPLRRFFNEGRGEGGQNLVTLLPQISAWMAQELQRQGYQGPAGIDAMIYRPSTAGGQGLAQEFAIRPLSELNTRYTMGHIALGLQKRLAPATFGLWLHAGQRDLASVPHPSFADLASYWQRRGKLTISPSNGGPRINHGVIPTTDPAHSQAVFTALAVGKNLRECRDLISPLHLAPLPWEAEPNR